MTRTTDDEARILVFAPVGRDGPVLQQVLSQAGFSAYSCTDLDDLIAALPKGAGAVLLAEEALFGRDISGLLGWISAQPSWSDLPFLVMTGKYEQHAISAWRTDVLATLRNVVLLERPLQTVSVVAAVKAAIRARQRQYEIRSLLEARERAAAELETMVELRTAELAAANNDLRVEMAERERIEQTLRQSQKIEAIGQLTGGIAHDFNNLLMVILGGLESFERNPDPQRRRRLLDGMKQAAQRGTSLTKQLLAFSRKQELKPEPIDLLARIEGMRELLDRSLRGDVEVSVKGAAQLWPVELDPTQLELTILNLCVNARDAMPKGGRIEITAKNVPGADSRSPDYVMLSVADSGTGMSDEVRARAFEPFFTTKDIGHGSGLGLAQVHGFAKQSGGMVQIQSALGAGTTISLLLPRSKKTPTQTIAPGLSAAPERQPASPASGAILLVEDDDAVATLLMDMLQQLGYEVVHRATGAAALEAVSNGRSIDVVLSDVMMAGGMNGIELARQLRQAKRHLPVVLMSGYADAALLDSHSAETRILAKPFNLNELASALRNARSGILASAGSASA